MYFYLIVKNPRLLKTDTIWKFSVKVRFDLIPRRCVTLSVVMILV